MGEVRDFPRAVCLYCGGDPHKTPLACPRIAHLTINGEGYVEGITFKDDFCDEEEIQPDPAA
jgi:hypothetical protein